MQSVGEKLKKARQEKDLTPDEVYRQIRIHPRVLEALEEDRAHNFLSFIYIKGFLRTYARFLGLDSERLLKEYIASQKVEETVTKVALEKKDKGFSAPNTFFILRVALVCVFAVALILYFRFVAKSIFRADFDKEVKVQKAQAQLKPLEQIKTEDLILEVRTKDACWMRVKADNRAIFEKTLPKGRRERWQAKEKIELRIGKPEALDIFLNGRPIDLKKERVKTNLVITHEGIKGK